MWRDILVWRGVVVEGWSLLSPIHSQVFCVHGGIPLPGLGTGDSLISTINEIPTHLPNPMEQSPLAWDIMWNDPIR